MRWYTRILYALLRALSRFSLRALQALGTAFGACLWWSRGRKRRIVETNLRQVRPALDDDERAGLARACLRETGRSLLEVFGIWGRAQRTLDAVREVRGGELFDAALAAKRGLILCAPHLGSWEVANYWIGARTPFATFYTQPRHPQLELVLRRLREGGASIQFPIDDSGVRRVFRHLGNGGVVSIMPDHVPRSGGIIVPFFGVPALTMTLLPRLARRTGAAVLMLFVERLPKAAGFNVHFREPPRALFDEDATIACSALNAAVQDCVEQAFTQYQWNYKRFKPRPGSGLADIYAAAGVPTTETDRMRWYVALTWILLRLLGLLPLRALHVLGAGIGRALWWRKRSRERVHVEVNLRFARPQLDDSARAELGRGCLRETGRAAIEIAGVWGRGARHALALVREVRGGELFDDALRAKRGLIIAAPHLGCWELLNYWLCSRTPIAILYAPPRYAAFEALLLRARGELAPQQVRADGAGVRTLYKRLAAGGVVGILPDQQPKRGEGRFAPFFGVEADTMVLLPRMSQRTGATVLFAFAERLPKGAGFRIHFHPASEAIADADLRVACTALNRGVQDCVELAFTQYQWTYKRWADRPDPKEADPYWLARNRPDHRL